jgi:hypothetical protein
MGGLTGNKHHLYKGYKTRGEAYKITPSSWRNRIATIMLQSVQPVRRVQLRAA